MEINAVLTMTKRPSTPSSWKKGVIVALGGGQGGNRRQGGQQ
jgi:hypothetical protein